MTLSQLANLGQLLGGIAVVASLVYLAIHRITSYNVCYTKLLRSFHEREPLELMVRVCPCQVEKLRIRLSVKRHEVIVCA